jgi:Malonate decarboxylase gamma subunit (MdcE)
VSAPPGPPILDALRSTLAFEPVGQAAGNLTIGRGSFKGRPLHMALVENRIASGSLGSLESKRLAALFTIVARERSSLVLFLDSAGARVSEGLRALGAFRALYRAGLEAALSPAPIAAVLGRNCYGGSSMLAHIAPQRLFSETTQMAMSGPSIMASSAGVNVLDEVFRAMAEASLSPAARAKASGANSVWKQGADLEPWLREALAQRGDAASGLRFRHEALAARFERSSADAPPEVLRRRDLEKIYPEGYEARESQGFMTGKGKRGGAEEDFAGIVGKNPLGAARAWRFADTVWRACDAPPRHFEVFLDCAAHAARLEDEKIVLTEYIVDMGYALAALAAKGTRVGLTIVGKAGGGVYVALAAPAARVTSVYGADIQVLPGAAVAAILGESHEETPGFAEYRAAGVADEELKLGFVPGTK